ncbi:MAG: hypothetical protein K6E50_07465 [Lachnospiraceae bacterium]|nr:hypothetical protein [Lachnospiraceae bacterium]
MKFAKIALISGVAVLIVLLICLVASGLLHGDKPEEKPEKAAVSGNIVEIGATTDSVKIVEVGQLSENTVLSESENSTLSENEPAEVSENEVPAVAEDGEDEEEDDESAPAEEKEEDDAGANTDQEALPEDLRAPFFLSFNGNPVIKLGDAFDVHKYVGYADDSDRHVDLEIAGEVNTGAEGTYPITLTIRDDAGRTASQGMKVTVVTELPSGGGYVGTPEPFSDFIAKYKTPETSVGIDISRWQETVDFEKVRAAGCEFVYMRIGGRDDGELYTDRYYKNNIAGAKAAGLKIGIYWHAEESTPQEVRESVSYLMGILDGEKLDFPIAYDWEDFLHFENYGMNINDLNRNLDVFVEEVKARGYGGCLYNSKYYLDTVWANRGNHQIWLAHYVSSTNYQGNYFMWQHGCTGRIDGINGDVDLDVLYNNALGW